MVKFRNLYVKTLSANSEEDIDKLVSEFMEDNQIEFTQTHVTWVDHGGSGKLVYTYVLFYVPKEKIKEIEKRN